MNKLINIEDVNNIKIQLKLELAKITQNYIPGAIVVPKGTELKGFTTVNMVVTSDDIHIFTLALNICDAIERIIDGDYNTSTILYVLDAEKDLNYFLNSSFKTQQAAQGIEYPDYYFIKTTHLMCSMIRDYLEIKVKKIK